MQAVMPGRNSVVSLCSTHTTDITRAVTRETRCKLMLYLHNRYRPRSHARDRMQAYVILMRVMQTRLMSLHETRPMSGCAPPVRNMLTPCDVVRRHVAHQGVVR